MAKPVYVAASGTKALVHTGECTVTTIHARTSNGSARFVQFFDAAATDDVTLGATTPDFVLCCSGTSINVQPTCAIPSGIVFELGLVVAVTTTATGATDGGTCDLSLALD